MAIELNVTPTITNLTVALYMLSMSIFPLWWSAFSERLGRRTIYIVSFAMSAVFSVLCAISNSIGMLIVMRMLAGGASASVQAVGAGTVADIWEVHERGKAMGVFYMGPLLGPLLAPIFGGLLSQKFGWRSTQWFLVIYASCLLVILTFCLPETLRDKTPATLPTQNTEQVLNEKHQASRPELTRVSTRQSVQKLTKTYSTHAYQIFIEPLTVLKYLRFPAVALTVYYASITFGSLYFLNISVQQSFALPPYSFSPSIIGLLYLPNSVGYFICSIFGGKWSDKIMAREARAANRYRPDGSLIYNPEDRMRENAWLAAAIYPAALIAYGWSVDRGVHWSVPLIANFFFGVGSMLVFSCATTMLTEFMPGRSSSGVAVNNFVRNLFSCTGAIVASPLIYAIGNGVSTLVSF
jgi:multidrug resistance protein